MRARFGESCSDLLCFDHHAQHPLRNASEQRASVACMWTVKCVYEGLRLQGVKP